MYTQLCSGAQNGSPGPVHTSPREASHAEQFREPLPSTDASGVELIGPIKMSICIPNALCRVIAGGLLSPSPVAFFGPTLTARWLSG